MHERIGREFGAFPALGVGIKHETAFIPGLHQHNADGGATVGRRGGQCEGVGVGGLQFTGFGEPGFEQVKGRGGRGDHGDLLTAMWAVEPDAAGRYRRF